MSLGWKIFLRDITLIAIGAWMSCEMADFILGKRITSIQFFCLAELMILSLAAAFYIIDRVLGIHK
jgi:hypothetical protein